MKQLAEIQSHTMRLIGEYQLLQTHWRAHPLSDFRYKKVLFIGGGALLVWLSRYPAVRRTYVLASLVTKTPFN
ncbi:MAG: hypothetical protein NVV73_10370 [Cellvibrionaceae bacterium]|nr:hypothetical protein [Cellvibrionaceae bacterium]